MPGGRFFSSGSLMESGWIKLHRKLLKSDVSGDINGLGVFVWCLLKANHEKRKWRGITIDVGQFVTGRSVASLETGLAGTTWVNVMERLERYGYIRQQSVRFGTLVTVVKYTTYQAKTEEVRQQPVSDPSTIRQPSVSDPSQTRTKELRTRELENERIKKSQSTDFVTGNGDETANPDVFFKQWQEMARSKGLPVPRRLTAGRRRKIKTRLADAEWIQQFSEAVEQLPIPTSSGFTWQPDLDWILDNDTNVSKLAEGKYAVKPRQLGGF